MIQLTCKDKKVSLTTAAKPQNTWSWSCLVSRSIGIFVYLCLQLSNLKIKIKMKNAAFFVHIFPLPWYLFRGDNGTCKVLMAWPNFRTVIDVLYWAHEGNQRLTMWQSHCPITDLDSHAQSRSWLLSRPSG